MPNRILIGLALTACAPPPNASTPLPGPLQGPKAESVAVENPASLGTEDSALRSLLEEHWELQMSNSPLWATQLGDRRFDHLLGDWGPAGHAKSRADRDVLLQKAEGLQPETEKDQLTLKLLLQKLRSQKALDVCAFDTWSFSPRD